ncbi:MAG: BamA/TamA family outer membrane protein [Bacteroidia bacterium]
MSNNIQIILSYSTYMRQAQLICTTRFIKQWSVLLLLVVMACNPARRVPEGQHLLNSITIKSDNIIENFTLDKEELLSIAKQKTNRTLLLQSGPRFYLYAYNFGMGRSNPWFKRMLTQKIGEEPVIIDSVLTKRTSKQMNNYLHNKGYFLSNVTDTVYYKGKRANVVYKVSAGKPYIINEYKYNLEDSVISNLVQTNSKEAYIKKGDNYDISDIERERERITKLLKNNGFYFFDKEFIQFDADSNLNAMKVNLTMKLNKLITTNDSLQLHKKPFYLRQYLLNNIYIDLDYNPLNATQTKSDTEYVRGYQFLYNNYYGFTRQIIRRSLFFEQGRYYSMADVENTYKAFADLHTFKFINIQFIPDNSDTAFDYINVHVQLSPTKRQNFDASLDGTNTGLGNLGIGGTLRLQNKNVLQGAETYELKLRGAIEAQTLLTDSTKTLQNNQFNTVLIAPELNITIPKHVLFLKLNNEPAIYKPRTQLGAAFKYQNRPDYQSTTFNTTFAGIYKFRPRWTLFFPQYDVSYAKYNLGEQLTNRLTIINNERLALAFSNVFITSFKVAVEKSSQDVNARGNYHYFKAGLEVAGTLTYLFNKYVQQNADTNTDGQYIFFGNKLNNSGSAYANFTKIDLEYRFFNPVGRKSALVYRLLGGIAVPYLNSGKVVPYTKTYFIGGSNDIRAWDARNIGPGGFGTTKSSNLNRIGDLKLEANAEVRFPLYKFIKGAYFIDAGNIWLLYPDVKRPNGNFVLKNVAPNIAVGTGVGLRLDFTYVIIRLDFATRIIDPEGPSGNTWAAPHIYSKAWNQKYIDINKANNPTFTAKELRYQHLNLNFGIGYPF